MLGLSTEKTDKPNAVLSNILNLKADTKDDKFSLLLKSFSFGKDDDIDLLKGLTDSKLTPKGEEKELTHDLKKLGILENLEDLKDLKDLKNIKDPDLLKKIEAIKDPLLLKKIEDLLQLDEKVDKAEEKSPLQKLFNLGKEDAKDEDLIHADIIKVLPAKTFKQDLQHLIGEAKAFLKEQISLKADIKDLPKTLGGLIKLAEKSGIDVRAISFEELPKTVFKEELAQVLKLAKPMELTQATLPHSTSQLVKPLVTKTEKESVSSKPLNTLLNKSIQVPVQTNLAADEVPSTQGSTSTKEPLFNASLNALLHGENVEEKSEAEIGSKIEVDKSTEKSQLGSTSKAEQLSQKVTEAKQLMQHVAQSMKESVENYKPPFTRIKMQLNPQKFGEMEVTLIQRGNNVHININANTTALTLMMQNSHELKAQLSAQGLGDASMNFTSHQQQQEQKQKQEDAGLTYEEFQEYEEEFTEIATALEVVVPRYI